jgi:hypothetical protein
LAISLASPSGEEKGLSLVHMKNSRETAPIFFSFETGKICENCFVKEPKKNVKRNRRTIIMWGQHVTFGGKLRVHVHPSGIVDVKGGEEVYIDSS